MRSKFMLVASCALIVSGSAALADCAEELAALEAGSVEATGGGIAKDGSLVPLEEGETAAAAGSEEAPAEGEAAGEGEVVKDGSVAPLEGDPGGASEDVAMSAQDAEAQQEGGETAMAAAEEGDGAGSADFASREEAIQAARDALTAGDEAACMDAVEAAKTL